MKKDARSWVLFKVFRIHDPETGALYLWRLRILETPWFGILLHRIHQPDGDRVMHDHPFSFVSLLLWGSYTEQCGVPLAFAHRRWVSVKAAEEPHRILELSRRPVWTLILRGPRRRAWGFHTPDGWVYWRDYLDERDGSGRAS